MDVKISDRGRVSYGRSREGEHDDLVIATALACWRARRKVPGFWGRGVWGWGEAERQVRVKRARLRRACVGHRFNKGRRKITGSMASIFRTICRAERCRDGH